MENDNYCPEWVNGCQCWLALPNHAEMHRVTIEEIDKGIRTGHPRPKKGRGCKNCTPRSYISHRWISDKR